jgi:pSer/pThr/pTyr-binding forkhead associated (FHA) protein
MRLIVVRGPSPAGPFDLREGVQHAGRGPECEVFLPSKRVSRKHAVIEVVGGRVEVRDLGSHNGILSADGTRVSGITLESGGRVQIGDYVLLYEGPQEDLLLEEEDDILLDDETAESAQPQTPRPVPAPAPPPPFAFGSASGGFGGPAPTAPPPAPPPPFATQAAARPAPSAPVVPPPPAPPFPPGFGARAGRGLPPDPSRSIVLEPEPEETRSDAPPASRGWSRPRSC